MPCLVGIPFSYYHVIYSVISVLEVFSLGIGVLSHGADKLRDQQIYEFRGIPQCAKRADFQPLVEA